MSKVKKQHYIPQYYLRNFSSDGEMLFIFDKPSARIFQSPILQIGQERYFYNTNATDLQVTKDAYEQDREAFAERLREIIENSGDEWQINQFQKEREQPDFWDNLYEIATNPQYMETKILAPHENKSASLLKQVMREIDKRKRIKRVHKQDVSVIMAIQYLRTPKYRNWNIDLQQKVMNELIKEMEDYDPEDEIRITYDRNFEDRITTSALLDPSYYGAIAQAFHSHIWKIGVNNTPQPFYTSDAPIVLHGHLNHITGNNGTGILSPGVEVAYPLSPSLIFLLYKRSFFEDKITDENRCVELSQDEVEFHNVLQVEHSRRQIYCSTNAFSLATEMCFKNPKLRELDRSSIHIS